MHVELITTDAALTELASDWNRLSRGVPFRTFEWLETWWRHYGTSCERSLHVLAVREGSRLVGIAPWFLHNTLRGGKVITFLGTGETYSDYLTILAEQGRESRVASAVARWLTDEQRGEWDALELSGVDGEDRTTISLLVDLELRGVRIVRRPDLHCWRIDLPSSWEEYLGQLSKSHRKQLRRAERRMEDEGTLHCWTANTPERLNRASEILVELHQKRHQALGRSGAFASPAFFEFQHEAMRRFAACGMLRLDVLELAGTPIAVEYQLVGSDVVYAYQAGIDPNYLSLEPGRLSMALAIRRAIDERFRAYDLLRGNEPYKAHWRATPRPTLRARAVAPHHVARLRSALWLAKDSAKHWVKQTILSGSND